MARVAPLSQRVMGSNEVRLIPAGGCRTQGCGRTSHELGNQLRKGPGRLLVFGMEANRVREPFFNWVMGVPRTVSEAPRTA